MTSMLNRLQRPRGPVDVVLDTDMYNEVDDQFALAYMLRSPEVYNVKALYAAPFFNEKSGSPGDGMERSYQEIFHILSLMEREDLAEIVYRGSQSYLPSETEPVDSDAARNLAKRAMEYTPEQPLYVVAIGAITNVASAILLDPRICDRIVIVWLGGHALHMPDTKEFNMYQDVAAARVVFGCGAALVQLPCKGVVSSFTISGPELTYHLRGKNKLCDYLVDLVESEVAKYTDNPAWTRVIWDVTAAAWLVSGEFMEDCLIPSPIPEYDGHYGQDMTRHCIRYVYSINRDALMQDLIRKLGA